MHKMTRTTQKTCQECNATFKAENPYQNALSLCDKHFSAYYAQEIRERDRIKYDKLNSQGGKTK